MYRAYDLDAVFNISKLNNVQIQLVLMPPEELAKQTYNDKWGPSDPLYNGYGWVGNPDSTAGSDFRSFYTDNLNIINFQNKVRYIQARWGYSPTLVSYEIVNEIDQTNYGHSNYFSCGSGSGIITTDIRNWVDNMSTYIKSLYPIHLTNVSFAVSYAGECSGINALPSTDFTNGHLYTGDENAENQRNYFVQNNIGKYNKPFVMTETNYGGCGTWISEAKSFLLHNEIWSTAFSGSMSIAFIFGADAGHNNPCWGGNAIRYYKSFSNFISNETFNSSTHIFYPVGNALSLYNCYAPLNQSAPPDAPLHDGNGFAPPAWQLDIDHTPIKTDFLVKDIITSEEVPYSTYPVSNRRKIEVFALKNQNRIIGWVHHKKSYWYNVPAGGNCPNIFNRLPLDASGSTHYADVLPPIIAPIINATITINNLRCNGLYKVQWYNTYFDYDAANPDGGNPISSSSFLSTGYDYNVILAATSGSLTFKIPPLVPLNFTTANGDPNIKPTFPGYGYTFPFAPDYGFKITYIGNNGIENGKWLHDYIDQWVTPISTLSSAKIDGDMAISPDGNNLFYSGADGYMHHFYWNASANKWNHDGLVTNWWAQDPNFKVAGKILVSPVGSGVFYVGADNRMQHYYWDASSSIWRHDYIDGYVTPYSTFLSAAVAGDMTISPDGNNLFYTGADGYMHHFYWNTISSQWAHDGLVAGWWTQDPNFKVAGKILVSPVGSGVFYVGADNRMQHYYWDASSSIWRHDYIDGYVTPYSTFLSAAVAGDMTISPDGNNLYYNGADGYMHHFYWNSTASQWAHDGLVASWWTQDPNFKISGKILVSPVGSGIFYVGSDSRMQHYYWDYPCEYFASGKRDNNILNSNIVQNNRDSISLLNCYPNPFDNELNIVYQIQNNNTTVSIYLYNELGILVKKIEDGIVQNSGLYNVKLESKNMSNGLYNIMLITNGTNIKTRKVILFKK